MTNTNISTAIVTGASGGIGAAVAERLAADGFAIAVHYGRDADAAQTVVRTIEAAGGRATAIQADLADPAGAAALFDAAEARLGAPRVLVNCAGVMSLSPLADADDASFARQVDINLGGVFRTMREAARRLSDGGRIVNLSTSVVGLYLPGYAIYAATKAAVEALTHVLAKELGPRAITVNTVAPGPVATSFFFTGKNQSQIDAIAAMNPFGRLGQPQDIANVVAFLAGPDGGWINGQTLRANGGVV